MTGKKFVNIFIFSFETKKVAYMCIIDYLGAPSVPGRDHNGG